MLQAFRYVAKRRRDDGRLHLAPFHLLDVAAVLAAGFAANPRLRDRLADRLGMPAAEVARLLPAVLALHDAGKLGSFQTLFRVPGTDATPLGLPLAGLKRYDTDGHRHDRVGQAMLRHVAEVDRGAFPPGSSGRAFNLLLGLSTGHHGVPPAAREAPGNHAGHFRGQDLGALTEWVRFVVGFFAWTAPPPAVDRLAAASYGLSGLITLCDWLGSHPRFEPHAEPMDLHAYWDEVALKTARAVLDEIRPAGLFAVERPVATGFAALMAHLDPNGTVRPSPMQEACEEEFPGDGPQGPTLVFIEDGMGSGKTDAGDLVVHRLIARGDADGAFFALPTMATADGAFRRKRPVAERLLGGRPSLVLRHGRSHLNDRFATAATRAEMERGDATALDWFVSARRALLADLGVGCIDAVLAGALRARHATVRLWGLDRKVLLVDEVHACDAYMLALLRRVLRWHAANGGSAVLMSATLPGTIKRLLTTAFGEGAGWSDLEERAAGIDRETYPLLTIHTGGRPPVQRPVRAAEGGPTAAPVRFQALHDADAVAERLVAWARDGRCAVWYRNTVGDAQAAYDRLRPRLAAVGAPAPILLHARFAYADRLAVEETLEAIFGKEADPDRRRGQVVLSTQAGEQSLDLDFDEMAVDLAPIDSLLQRLGRRRRHRRDAAGRRITGADRRPDSDVLLLTPSPETIGADWYARLFRGAAQVYPDHARLWLTASILLDPERWLGERAAPGCLVPDRDARHAVERVYADTEILLDHVPECLRASLLGAAGTDLTKAEIGDLTAFDFTTGGWLDDWARGVPVPDDESVAVTRLGENWSAVLLVRDGDGLRFLHDGTDPVELSGVRLNQALCAPPGDAAAVATWTEGLESAVARRLLARRFVVVTPKDQGFAGKAMTVGGSAPGKEVAIVYDAIRGFQVDGALRPPVPPPAERRGRP